MASLSETLYLIKQQAEAALGRDVYVDTGREVRSGNVTCRGGVLAAGEMTAKAISVVPSLPDDVQGIDRVLVRVCGPAGLSWGSTARTGDAFSVAKGLLDEQCDGMCEGGAGCRYKRR